MGMELPKNIVWIGNPDKVHKIYVEDYVISYIKQINRELFGCRAGIALYGKKCDENNEKYYFLYGAAQILGLEGRGQYLSEMEKEAVWEIGSKYFQEYEFIAWCSLEGELPDGFYLYEMGKGLYINGYACFYEKNESMLNFMLTTRKIQNEEKKEPAPKVEIPGPSQEARAARENHTAPAPGGYRELHAAVRKSPKTEWMKTAVVGMAAVLCILGVATLSDQEKLNDIKVIARQVVEHMGEQKLPDKEDTGDVVLPQVAGDDIAAQTGKPQEPAVLPEAENQVQQPPSADVQGGTASQENPSQEASSGQVQQGANTETGNKEQIQDLMEQENQKEQVKPATQPAEIKTVSYVVSKGDTLLSISKTKYGTSDRVKEICTLNGIANADDIKIGQIILLPE